MCIRNKGFLSKVLRSVEVSRRPTYTAIGCVPRIQFEDRRAVLQVFVLVRVRFCDDDGIGRWFPNCCSWTLDVFGG